MPQRAAAAPNCPPPPDRPRGPRLSDQEGGASCCTHGRLYAYPSYGHYPRRAYWLAVACLSPRLVVVTKMDASRTFPPAVFCCLSLKWSRPAAVAEHKAGRGGPLCCLRFTQTCVRRPHEEWRQNPPMFENPYRLASSEKAQRGRWRREWDSNPRYGFPYTRFPSVRLKPLGHPSGSAADRAIYHRWSGDNPAPGRAMTAE
jgi:hypothetical protein